MNLTFNKIKKKIIYITSGIIILFLIFYISYEYYKFTHFKKYLPEIEIMFSNNENVTNNLSPLIRNTIAIIVQPDYFKISATRAYIKLWWNSLSKKSLCYQLFPKIQSHVAKSLLNEIKNYNIESRYEQLCWLIWTLNLDNYFSKEQIVKAYICYMPYEQGYGIVKAAKYYFVKDLDELNVNEVIALLVISYSPNFFSPYENPDRFYKKYNMLKSKYQKNLNDFLKNMEDTTLIFKHKRKL